jgi:hypothetical protein
MKVQAMRDVPERGLQDLMDIGYLLQVEGVDREEVHGYFVRAGLEALVPPGALDRRPVTRPDARPFTLEGY